jgi:hypothetical protein
MVNGGLRQGSNMRVCMYNATDRLVSVIRRKLSVLAEAAE